MGRAKNRRVAAARGTPRERVRAPGRPAKRVSNARKLSDVGASPGRKLLDPTERRARNRTLLILGVLGLINAYVFGWRSNLIEALSVRPTAIVGADERAFAEPLEDSCGGDPVRVFAGLDDQVRMETRLAQGRTLRLGLIALGVSGPDIDAIEQGVRAQIDLGLVAGQGAPLRLATDRFGAVSAFEIEVAEGRVVQGCRRAGAFLVRHLQHPLRTDVVVTAIEIGSDGDLVTAIEHAGEDRELGPALSAVLAHDVDLASEIHPGDRIDVVVEKRFLGKNLHRYGRVLAVRFRGTATTVAYYSYKPAGAQTAYYDADGEPVARALLRSPIAWTSRGAGSVESAMPTIEIRDGRSGAVFRRPEGTPVVALADATVRSIDANAQEGLVVELVTDDGTVIRHGHLMRVLGELRPGQSLGAGQAFALVGRTGKTPNSRLRLEIASPDGRPIEPLSILSRGADRPPRVGVRLSKRETDGLREAIAPWRKAIRAQR